MAPLSNKEDFRKTLEKAEALLQEVRLFLSGAKQTISEIANNRMVVMKELGQFDTQVVLLSFGKKCKHAENIGAAAALLVSRIASLLNIVLTSRWDDQLPKDDDEAKASETTPQANQNFRALDEVGNVGDVFEILNGKGFQIGDFIKHKTNNEYATIIKTSNTGVEIEFPDKNRKTVPIEDFQLLKWRGVEKPQALENINEWQKSLPCSSTEFALLSIKGAIAKELFKFDALSKNAWQSKLIVRTSSTKREALANCAIQASKLMLVPSTLSVTSKAAGESGSGLHIGNALKIHGKDYSMYLSSCFVVDAKDKSNFINPFWLVGTTNDEAEANMELSEDLSKHTITRNMSDFDIKLPFMYNTVPLKDGDVLKVYKAPPAPKAKAKAKQVPNSKKRKASS